MSRGVIGAVPPCPALVVTMATTWKCICCRGRGPGISTESNFAHVLQTCPLVLGPKAVTSQNLGITGSSSFPSLFSLLDVLTEKKKNKTPPKSWELHFILLTKLRTSAQDTASQVALRDSSEEAGWSQDIWMFVQQRPGSWDLKSLLVIKENQTSQVREFSAFLSIGSFKSPGWLMLFLGSAPQLSRANVLYFVILSFFRVYSWGDGCSDWLLLAGIQFPAWVSSGLTVGVDLMQWLDGCNVLCLLIQQAMLFIHGVKKLFSGECVCVCVCAHTCVLNCFSHVRIFAILCTVTRQAPLSLRFSMQDYRVGRR